MSCANQVSVWVSRGYGYKEVKTACGNTGLYGEQMLCDECRQAMEDRYPQGWRHAPGDTCEHGRYLGCHEDNDETLCPECEA
jgi:hypothetical protein